MKKNILCVDNSTNTLECLKWILEDEPYYLFLFDNPFEALSVINATEFPVVVADQSVSGIDGIEFLKRVKQRSPDTLGIIMTGYVYFKDNIDPVDNGYVFLFVKKPLTSEGIKHAVRSALSHYEINTAVKKQVMLTPG